MKQYVQEYNNSQGLDHNSDGRKATSGEILRDIRRGEGRNKMQNYCLCNSVSLVIGVRTLDSDD